MLKVRRSNLIPGIVYIGVSGLFLENYSYFNLPDLLVTLIQMLLVAVCVFGFIWTGKINLKRLLVALFVLFLVAYNANITGDYILLNIALVLLSTNADFDVKKIIRIVMWMFVTYTLIMFLSTKAGILYDRTIANSITGELRHSYGYTHPNRFGAVLMMAALINYYIYYKTFTKKNLLVPTISFVLCALAKSRTSLILVILILALSIYRCFMKNKEVKVRFEVKYKLLCFGIFFIVAFGFISALMYDSSSTFWSSLNFALSQRLRLAHNFLNEYPITLFGQSVKFVYGEESILTKQAYATIDSLYIYLLLKWGLLITGFIFSLYIQYIRAIKERKAIEELIIVLCIALFSFSENQLLEVGLNFTFLMLARDFWKAKNKGKAGISIEQNDV